MNVAAKKNTLCMALNKRDGVLFGPCLCNKHQELNDMHSRIEELSHTLEKSSRDTDKLRNVVKMLLQGRHPFYAPVAKTLKELGLIRLNHNGKLEIVS